jgi:hypothetical protein
MIAMKAKSLHSMTAFTAPSVSPSSERAQVQDPGDQIIITPSSEQLTTYPFRALLSSLSTSISPGYYLTLSQHMHNPRIAPV